MGSRIENVIRAAVHTFSKTANGCYANENIGENIQLLRQLVCDITAEDVGLNQSLSYKKSLTNKFCSTHYVEIFENQSISVGIFIIKDGASIPMHDHLGMFGLLKVLTGNLKLQSYTPVAESLNELNQFTILATKSSPALLTEKDGTAILFPKENNIHELGAIDGLASFLDILSPPYKVDGDPSLQRDCHYYKEIEARQNTAQDLNSLLRIPCPLSFTCSRLPYCGPNINHLSKMFPV